MNKYFIFALISVLLFIPFGLSSKTFAQKKKESKPPPPLVELEKLELDKSEVVIPCPPMQVISEELKNSPCYNENGLVTVKTTVSNPKKMPIIHEYTVSGGRIVGQGEKVVWDLNGIRPGKYTITAAIDYGRGFNEKTASQVLEITDGKCCCYLPCVCPTTFSVTASNNTVKAGENIEFIANVLGGSAPDIRYNWTISRGEIIEGQGTSKIVVKTTKEMDELIRATVTISGDLCENCERAKWVIVEIIK